MTLPLALLLIPYLILLIVFLVTAITNAYHVTQFGAFDTRNKVVLAIFIFYSISILAFAVLYLLPVDWSASLALELPFTISTDVLPAP